MTSGNLDLNGNDLTLGTANGTIMSESESSRVTGPSGGVVRKTMDLNAPSSVNPGNIGVAITSSENMGSTTIERSHVPESIGGGSSIERSFAITPTTNTDLDATARFSYFDAELNGNTDTDLGPWRQDDTFWFNPEASATSTTLNNKYVESSGICLFSKWTLAPAAAKLRLKVNLQGPYSFINSNMNDDLRTGGHIDVDEPYEMLGYDHVASGSGESIDPSLLNVTTGDAPVDWVFVELRDALDNTVVVAARSAILQKDGDIVDLDGKSPVSFPGLAVGTSYFIAVHHRNHLAIMTATAQALN